MLVGLVETADLEARRLPGPFVTVLLGFGLVAGGIDEAPELADRHLGLAVIV
jgi:hypothetical protein